MQVGKPRVYQQFLRECRESVVLMMLGRRVELVCTCLAIRRILLALVRSVSR